MYGGIVSNSKEKLKTKVLKEFSRFANEYDKYNIIQAEVAKRLVSYIPLKPYSTIIDIGCGSGEVYKNIQKGRYSFEHFIALDYSEEMLDIHPFDKRVIKICADFNTSSIFENLSLDEDMILLSSSALQWSKDLDFTLYQLSHNAPKAYFAIFTSSTFKTLHQIAGIESPIYGSNRLKEVINRYYNASFTIDNYSLHFDSIRDMFRYIKKSGVSGGEKRLSYKEIKSLMQKYPLDYLEFEVLFVEATSKEFFMKNSFSTP